MVIEKSARYEVVRVCQYRDARGTIRMAGRLGVVLTLEPGTIISEKCLRLIDVVAPEAEVKPVDAETPEVEDEDPRAKKMWTCDKCGKVMGIGSKGIHLAKWCPGVVPEAPKEA